MLLIISGPTKAEVENQLQYKHVNLELLGHEADARVKAKFSLWSRWLMFSVCSKEDACVPCYMALRKRHFFIVHANRLCYYIYSGIFFFCLVIVMADYRKHIPFL